MLHPVPAVHHTPRLRSLPWAFGSAPALIVASAAPASAQGPGGAAAFVGDEGMVAAAPGATPQQPPVGGVAPGTPVQAVQGEFAQPAGVQALPPSTAPAQVVAAVAAANAIVGSLSGRGPVVR